MQPNKMSNKQLANQLLAIAFMLTSQKDQRLTWIETLKEAADRIYKPTPKMKISKEKIQRTTNRKGSDDFANIPF